MAELMPNNSCCAISELDGISYDASPKATIDQFIEECGYENCGATELSRRDVPGIVIFTEVSKVTNPDKDKTKTGYGKKLAAFITQHKLGTVVAGPATPNYQNHPTHVVTPYFWRPSFSGLQRFARKM